MVACIRLGTVRLHVCVAYVVVCVQSLCVVACIRLGTVRLYVCVACVAACVQSLYINM